MTPQPQKEYSITEDDITTVLRYVLDADCDSFDEWVTDVRRRSRPGSSCAWKLDDVYGMYETGCGNAFECIEGDIEENNFKFCPYCGGRIKEIVEGGDE